MYAVVPLQPNTSGYLYLSGVLFQTDKLDLDAVSRPNWPANGTLFGVWALSHTMTDKEAAKVVKLVEPSHVLVFVGAVLFFLDGRHRSKVAAEY